MTITNRTLIWLGVGVALFAWGGLGILLGSVPPATGPLILFFGFAFLAVASTFLIFLALWQHSRGVPTVGSALRRSLLAGTVAVILLGLQYARLLTLMIGGAVVVLALIVEVLIVQLWRRQPSPPSTPPRGHTMASQAPRRSRSNRRARKSR